MQDEYSSVIEFANEIYNTLDTDYKETPMYTPYGDTIVRISRLSTTGEILGKSIDTNFAFLLPPPETSIITYSDKISTRYIFVLAGPDFQWKINANWENTKRTLKDIFIRIYGYTGMDKTEILFQNKFGKTIATVYISPPRIINLEDICRTIRNFAKDKKDRILGDIEFIIIKSQYDTGLDIPSPNFTSYDISILRNFEIPRNREEILRRLDHILSNVFY